MKFKTCRKYNIPGHIHEFTFSCFKNRNFLKSDEICKVLLSSIYKARAKHRFDLLAFVFMPNHVHLIIRPRMEKYSISKILSSIKQPVGREVINKVKNNFSDKLYLLEANQKHAEYRFWQDGSGYDRNITSKKALIKAIEYIHNNPVRAGLVEGPEHWKWSSANPEFKYLIEEY